MLRTRPGGGRRETVNPYINELVLRDKLAAHERELQHRSLAVQVEPQRPSLTLQLLPEAPLAALRAQLVLCLGAACVKSPVIPLHTPAAH